MNKKDAFRYLVNQLNIGDIINNHLLDDGDKKKWIEDFVKDSYVELNNNTNEYVLKHYLPYSLSCDCGWKYKSYELDLINGLNIDAGFKYGPLVRLNRNNANIIEQQISDDPSYVDFIKFTYLYYKDIKKDTSSWDFYFSMARIIDIVNSTNVWRYKKNRPQMENIVDWIVKNKRLFLKQLKTADKNLPDTLLNQVNIQVPNSTGGPQSFCSKLCKYLNEYLWPKNTNPRVKRYFINDSFIRKMLPYYCDYYGVKVSLNNKRKASTSIESMNYSQLFILLDSLLKAANAKERCKLSRSELDHIIWYCYKSFER